MNTDERIQQYFRARSQDATSPGAPLEVVLRRGRGRKRRRDAVRAVGVAAVVAVAGVAATQGFRGTGAGDVDTSASPVASSGLTWAKVDPGRAIGESRSAVEASDGSVYELSTAPGSKGRTGDRRPALFRSIDERSWSDVDLPADLTATGIAVGGDQIYAVGTGPAGGGVERVTVASADSGTTDWSTTDLDLDLAARAEATGLDIRIDDVRVARLDGTTIVAVATRASDDLADVDGLDPLRSAGEEPVGVSPDGVLVLPASCVAVDSTGTAVSIPTSSSSSPAGATGSVDERCVEPQVRPWSSVDVSDEVRRELVGEVLVLVSADGGSFDEVRRIPGESDPNLLVDGAGAWLATRANGSGDSTHLWHAVDPVTWASTGGTIVGSVIGAGTVAGRARFAMASAGDVPLTILDTSGVQPVARPVDLGAGRWPTAVAFGPLGVAVAARDDGGGFVLLHSADALEFAPVPLELGDRETIVEITVSADAVTVRLNDRSGIPADDVDTPGAIRLFVGTPD